MIDVIILFIIAALVGGASYYIYKKKKQGVQCIGCSMAGTCGSKANGTCHCDGKK